MIVMVILSYIKKKVRKINKTDKKFSLHLKKSNLNEVELLFLMVKIIMQVLYLPIILELF
jgi:hypothetical protein